MNNATKRMVTVLMNDGVDICVIDDILNKPAHYIRTLSICDGEFIDLPLFCFYNDARLTPKAKETCLNILSEHVCLWNALNTINSVNSTDSVDVEDDLSEEELNYLLNFVYK